MSWLVLLLAWLVLLALGGLVIETILAADMRRRRRERERLARYLESISEHDAWSER